MDKRDEIERVVDEYMAQARMVERVMLWLLMGIGLGLAVVMVVILLMRG